MAAPTFQDRSIPGGIIHNPASAHSREMAKWEMGYSPYGPPGRPRESVGHQEYPAMMYKVRRSDTNGDILTEHMTEAENENHARLLESQGYVQGLAAAHAKVEEYEQMIARAAAERAFKEKGMGEKARAEAAAADDAVGHHLAEVPVTPVKPRAQRRTKAQMIADGDK